MQTTIRIDSQVRDRLETLKQDGENLGDVVQRLANAYNPFAGLGAVLAMPEVSAAVHADYQASLESATGENGVER
ncbi:DUF7557 family protein [Glycomyces buryatensis]|uniref:Uncharacterized protein n=1 Tax=Glycomyces buryatensis TaxID=2570927 RepID=A0A4S8QCC0_9ACTN|nr:hypothetical protein [Glycomyces buryatensis]THV41231.1 hypothetical protein FAB82_12410 [Glycomyces buryatensis]